jgi:hypothetical protein
MRRFLFVQSVVAGSLGALLLAPAPAAAQQQTLQNPNVPKLAFESNTTFLKFDINGQINFGETMGVAVNSKGQIAVLNHPGTSTSGPLYGNATTQVLLFDATGKFLREIGKGVYGFGYAHGIRYDKYDNLWVSDKGTHSVMKFDPTDHVVLNLGRRPEGPDIPEKAPRDAPPPVHRDGNLFGPTNATWDAQDNIYVSDGYFNSRVAKFNKNGDWIKGWGQKGSGGVHANENPGNFSTVHDIASDRQGNIYVADRGNRRIQVFDSNGTFKQFILLNAPYDKTRHPALGNLSPNPPDETAPWAICISDGPTQFIWVSDTEPGRIYKVALDGKILGMLGESGRGPGQFNWTHGISCSTDGTIWVADMNNWRVHKITLK